MEPVIEMKSSRLAGESLNISNDPFIVALRFHIVASVADLNAP